jgi:hypothetical protein
MHAALSMISSLLVVCFIVSRGRDPIRESPRLTAQGDSSGDCRVWAEFV